MVALCAIARNMRGLLAALGLALVASACGPTPPGAEDAAVDGDGTPLPDAPVDGDGDGYFAGSGGDCDDTDPNVHPGATESCANGADDDCNGFTDTDDLVCLPPCEVAERTDSYFGCKLYAVDLPQFDTSKKFGISVSNPSDSATANVTISTSAGVVATLAVPPRGVQAYEEATRAYNIPGAGIHDRIFSIESDLPIAAYQFNSIDTLNAASTDASLLFATHNLAKLYYVMDYNSSSFTDNNFIAVYAVHPDTNVTIYPTTTVSGATTATLQPMQVMVVMAVAQGSDLTGSRVEADKEIGVFGGNRCTNVPSGMSYCDHLEQQIFPRQAMGMRYIVGKTHARTHCAPPDHIRVLADTDGTTVTFDPPVAGPWTLNAGQWMEATITGSVEITATNAVLVGQFIRSSNGGECMDEGDPAFMLQVPVAQYRTDYVFLTPTTYDTDYVDIMAPAGAFVSLDGAPLTLDATPIGATGYTLTSVVVQDGPHVVEANMPVGVMVYGYGGPSPPNDSTQNVSYGYPGGLDLAPINPIE